MHWKAREKLLWSWAVFEKLSGFNSGPVLRLNVPFYFCFSMYLLFILFPLLNFIFHLEWFSWLFLCHILYLNHAWLTCTHTFPLCDILLLQERKKKNRVRGLKDPRSLSFWLSRILPVLVAQGCKLWCSFIFDWEMWVHGFTISPLLYLLFHFLL